MEPKEKAKDLYKKSLPLAHDWESENKVVAKKIALLCVDEITKATSRDTINEETNSIDVIPLQYWVKVKDEINKF